jgi:hypothetical protein
LTQVDTVQGIAGPQAHEASKADGEDHHRHQHGLGVAIGLEHDGVAQRGGIAKARTLHQQAGDGTENESDDTFDDR